MLVGNFKHNPEVGLVTGYIRTKTLEMPYVEMHFIPEDQRTERGPAAELYEPNVAGKLAPVGTLWERPMKDGKPYLAGFIDDEVAKEEKQMAFFGNPQDGYDVQYRRGSPQFNGNGGGNGAGRGGQRGGGQRPNGGFSGGSTAGPGGEYVGGSTRRDLDDDVPF